MFLKNIVIKNFRSIQYAKADFDRGLNIVIGKNGVGKSNLLKYISQNVNYNAVVARSKQLRSTNVEFEYTVCYNDQEENLNELTIYFKRERVVNNNELDFVRQIKLSKTINNISIYQDKYFDVPATEFLRRKNENIDEFLKEFEVVKGLRKRYVAFELPRNPGWLENSIKYEVDIEYNLESDIDAVFSEYTILWDLHNMSELIFMTQIAQAESASRIEDIDVEQVKQLFQQAFESMKAKYDLDDILSKYSPIEGIRLNPNINSYYTDNKIFIENLIIEFRVNNSWIPWGHLSDGTKRLFYLITQCLSVDGGMLLIEEPELGIHPHQLYSLMQFIRDQSNDKQIIVSTHSPIVLDILTPTELNKINIAKLTPSGSQFFKLTDEQVDTAKKYMELVGELSHYWLHSDLENE